MIIFVENLKELTKELLELIHDYSRVARYRANTQKSITFLYVSSEKQEFKNIIPFTLAPPKMK